MATIGEFVTKLQAVKDNIAQIIGSAMEDNERSVLDYNRSQLYDEGIDRFGLFIQPPYAFSTVAIKKKKGQPADRVTGYDTGEMHRRLYLVISSDLYDIKSRSESYPEFVKKYGDDPFGLTEQSKRSLWISFIKGYIVRKITA